MSELAVGLNQKEWARALPKTKAEAYPPYRDKIVQPFNVAPAELSDEHFAVYDQLFAFAQCVEVGLLSESESSCTMLTKLAAAQKASDDAIKPRRIHTLPTM